VNEIPTTDTRVPRPILTMPPAEAEVLTEVFTRSAAILEYGSGGSTILAAEMPDKRISSVESDGAWIAKMRQWFLENPPVSAPLLHYGNIGPTRSWGYPATNASFRRWPGYAQSIWDHPEFSAPDAVLIDGRFRLACLLTVAQRTQKPVTVLVDDYVDRPPYHEAEPLLGKPVMIGRMARFDLSPGMIPIDRLRLVIESHLRPL